MERRTIVVILVAAVVIGLGYFVYTRYGPQRAETAPEVAVEEEEEIVPIVSASGTVLPAKWAQLSFNIGGRVEELAVEVGDEVVAGQLLARLDSTELAHAVAQVRTALATARAQLAAAKAGATPEEIAAAEGAVIAAQGGVAAAKARLTQAEIGAEIAGANLKQAEDAVDAAEAALAQAWGTLDMAKADLDSAEAHLDQVLAVPDEKAIETARLNLEQARNNLWNLQLERDAQQGRPTTPGYVLDQFKANIANAEIAIRQAEIAYEQAQAGATDEETAAAKAGVSAAQAQVTIAEAGVDAAEAALAQAQDAVVAAQGQVSLARADVVAAQAQVEVAEGQLAQAKAQRDRLKAGATAEEIGVLEAQVAQAEAALARAESALAKATLVAPFAGTVGAVYLRESEVIAAGTSVLVLGDVSTLRVETTDLNEVDIARVAVGSPVTLTFDALPERTTKGQVVRIAPMASVSQGGTNFTAVIEMTSPPEELRWGMTAFVDIGVDR